MPRSENEEELVEGNFDPLKLMLLEDTDEV